MSIIADEDVKILLDLLRDASNQLRLLNARTEAAFETDINMEDIQKLEDLGDDTTS